MIRQSNSSDDLPSPADTENVPIPPRYRWLKRFTLAGVCMLAGLVVLRLWWGYEADRRLQAEIARYRAAGQPVYAEEFDRKLDAVKPEDNAALLLEEAMSKIESSASGVHLNTITLWLGKIQVHWDAAKELVEANAEALELAHRARSRPLVAWSQRLQGSGKAFDPQFGVSFGPDGGSRRRALGQLLWMAAAVQRLSGDHAAAVRTIHDAVAYCEALQSHPTFTSHVMAGSHFDRTFTLVEDLTPGLSIEPVNPDASVSEEPVDRSRIEALLAALLDERAFRRAPVNSHYGDRAFFLDFVDSLGWCGIYDSPSPGVWRCVGGFARRPILLLDALRDIRMSSVSAEALAKESWPEADEHFPVPEGGLGRPSYSLTFPLSANPPLISQASSLKFSVERHFTCLARRRMAATALAIVLFQHDHGGRPSALGALVPDYLPRVPLDPFARDNAALRYQNGGEHPILYSVGPNGRDDGGSSEFSSTGAEQRFERHDIVFHLTGTEEWRAAKLLELAR